MRQHGRELADEEWERIRDIVDYVREIWDEPDAGIWEVRGGNEHFVYSKVMCWVALDRGIAIVTDGDHDASLEAWRETRETIRMDVLENGYDEDIEAFVQSYGTGALDATGLLLPIIGFLPFDDDRIQKTIDAIEENWSTMMSSCSGTTATTGSRATRGRSSSVRAGSSTRSPSPVTSRRHSPDSSRYFPT